MGDFCLWRFAKVKDFIWDLHSSWHMFLTIIEIHCNIGQQSSAWQRMVSDIVRRQCGLLVEKTLWAVQDFQWGPMCRLTQGALYCLDWYQTFKHIFCQWSYVFQLITFYKTDQLITMLNSYHNDDFFTLMNI